MGRYTINQSNAYSLYTVCLTILILINAGIHNILLSLFITILAFLSITKPNNLIAPFFLTSLSSDYFVAIPGMGFARIFSVIFIINFILNIKNITFKNDWNLNMFFIVITTVITFLLSNRLDINALLGNLLNIIIFLIFVNLNIDKSDLEKILSDIYIAILILILFIFFQNLINPTYLISGRLSLGNNVNENRFAMLLGQVVAYIIGYIFSLKTKRAKAWAVIFIGIGVYLMLLSGSRSAIIGLLLGSLCSLFIFLSNSRNKTKLFGVFTILGILGNYLFNSVIESSALLSTRFDIDQIVSTGGTHRLPRIILELKYVIPRNLFFGVGLTAENETIALTKYTLFPGSSHNFIVSMLTQVGVFGFIAHITFFMRLIKKLVNKIQDYQFLLIPLILISTASFNGIGEVIYNDRLYWNALSLAGLCLATIKYRFNEN